MRKRVHRERCTESEQGSGRAELDVLESGASAHICGAPADVYGFLNLSVPHSGLLTATNCSIIMYGV